MELPLLNPEIEWSLLFYWFGSFHKKYMLVVTRLFGRFGTAEFHLQNCVYFRNWIGTLFCLMFLYFQLF